MAGLMYIYLRHLGYQVKLVQGSMKRELRGKSVKILHTWIEVERETIEIAWTHPQAAATKDSLFAYKLKRMSTYLKDEVSSLSMPPDYNNTLEYLI